MRFLIDACLPRAVAKVLENGGHEAMDVRDLGIPRPDQAVAEYARANALCIVTEDFDFADVRHYPPADYAGIVVFETEGMGRQAKLELVESFINQLGSLGTIEGKLVIVGKRRIRIWRGTERTGE